MSLITGLLVVGHMLWAVYGTGLATARAQSELRRELGPLPTVEQLPYTPTMPARFEPGTALGVIRIPRIDLDMVFVEGTSGDVLEKGPGHYAGTAYPWDGRGRVGIAGHRTTYGHPFLHLDDLRPGDRIEVATEAGTFEYRVTYKRYVSPQEVSVLHQTKKPTLILTTCAPVFSASQRLVVFARRV